MSLWSHPMNLKTSLLIQCAFLAIIVAASAYYFKQLPDSVPTHWNIEGKVDQYGSKLTPVLMGPGMVLFGILLTVVLPKISPKMYEIDKFESTYAYAMVLVSGLFFFISFFILKASSGSKLDFGTSFMAAMFIFFALLGNVLGKVRRNFFMGIRTPWTIASEPVWDATHRAAGRIWFVGGLIGAVISIAGMPMMASMTLLVVMAFIPVFHSYLLYKKLEK